MMEPSSPRHLSRYDIARALVADENREPGTPQEVAAHLADCERCRRVVAEARADGERFRAFVLPRTLPSIATRGAGRSRRGRLMGWVLGGGLAAVGVAAAVLIIARPRPDPVVLVKGHPALQVYAKRGDSVVRVSPGVRLRAGDLLRFEVSPGNARFVLVASLDGRGVASIYYPSTAVPPGGGLLPDSIELDDAPGFERVYALFSSAPIGADEVSSVLAELRGRPAGSKPPPLLALPYAQVSLTFDKEPRR